MSAQKEKQLMDLEDARKIWRGSDMSEQELVEWVRLVNQRIKNFTEDEEQHVGETIEI
jgi:hypothetical protein